MTLVCQSIVLLELTQCSSITARKKEKNQPASAQSKKPKPISSMETCFCIRLHGLLLLKKTAVSGTPGWWHWNYTHTHTNQSVGKTGWRLSAKSAQREAEGKLFTLLCNQLALGPSQCGQDWTLFWYLYLWLLYSNTSLLRSWLGNLSLFSRHLNISSNLFKWHISRCLSALLNRMVQSMCLNVLLNN